jgi:hypothetical protein
MQLKRLKEKAQIKRELEAHPAFRIDEEFHEITSSSLYED